MQLSVGTNWDPGLIDSLSRFPVYELFGSLDATPVGGGRPSLVLGNVTQQQAASYIAEVHRKGWTFNYVLNAPCMGNMEYSRETHRRLLEHIEWLCETGVDAVTVSIPYLLEIVKRQFPQLRTKVSVIAHVNTVARACFYEALGADEIMLDYMSNRDFRMLKKVRRAVKCDLSLLLNDMCLYQCPYRTYHYNLCGHASQDQHPLEGYYIDYCLISCVIDKLSDPVQLIRSRWIRPEDVERYEALGYARFKVSGRRMSTAWLTRAVTAYASRRYEGNLMDIVDGITPGVDPDIHSPQYEKMLNPKHAPESERLNALGQIFPVKPYVDNRKLDGFLDHFEKKDCANECATCSYCEKTAAKAVHLDQAEINRYLMVLRDLHDDLVSSRIFVGERGAEGRLSDVDGRSNGDDGAIWDPVARAQFEYIIGSVPQELRAVAAQVIDRGSREIARQRQSRTVGAEEMVQAFLRYTPDPYRAQILATMRSLGFQLEAAVTA